MTHPKAPFKSPYSCIDPEDMLPHAEYSFSFNPVDDHQYWGKDDRLNAAITYQKRYGVLHVLHDRSMYNIEVMPEISSQGRIHYHGTIKFRSSAAIRTFFIDHVIRIKAQCTYEIDHINDMQVWLEYCTKQVSLLCCKWIKNEKELIDKQPFLIGRVMSDY